MAGYPVLNKRKEELLVGRTSDLYKHGYTPEEIAGALDQPLQRVNYWICLIKQADKIRDEIRTELNV